MNKLSKRAISILVIAIFLISMIPIIPAIADMTIDETKEGTAEWVQTPVKVGYYSLHVQLVGAEATSGHVNVEIILDTPILFSTFTETDFKFWEYVVNPGGVADLAATMCLLIDADDSGTFVWGLDDVQIVFESSYITPPVTDEWIQKDLTGRDGFDKNSGGNIGTVGPLADLQAIYGTHNLLGVNVMIGWGAYEDYEGYWDDVIVDGVTYPLTIDLPEGEDFSIDYVTPGDVEYDDTLTVMGTGVTAGTTVNVYWDYASGTYTHLLNSTEGNPDGSFELEIDVPSDIVGEHFLWAKDVSTGTTISYELPINMIPKITLSPSSGLVDDDVTIKGYGFTDEANFTSITFGGAPLTTSPQDVETDEYGYFTYSFDVPDTAVEGINVVRVQDWYTFSDSADFTLGASIILDPDEGPTGSKVEVEGRGWTEDAIITFKMNGAAVQVVGDPVIVKYDGTFSAKIIIPNVDSLGEYVVEASESGDVEGPGSDKFEVDGLPKIKISPEYGTPGATVEIEGYNFTQITDTEVYLNFGDISKLETFETDSKGEFSGTFQVQAVDFIDYTITAYDEYGLEDDDTFRVGMMVILISPRDGPAGDWIYLSGTGFSDEEDWNASIEGKLIASGDVTDTGLISDHFYVPTLEPGTYTVTVMDIDTDIELTTILTVTDTTSVTLDPPVAPNDYNVTIKGYNFADKPDGTLDFVIYNSTHEWDMDVDTNFAVIGHKTTLTDKDGNFTGHWHIPEKDVISIGDYTINITDSEDLFAQVPFSVVTARVSVEPRKALFDRGDTIQFNVKNDFDFKESYMRIWDPDDNLYWETGEFGTWLKVGTLYTVPYYLQTSGGNLMELAQDAPMGEWFWIFYEEGTTQLVNGTFDVGPSTAAQIDAMLGDVMDDMAGLSDDMAGMSDDFAEEMAGMSADFADDMAAMSDDFSDDIAGLADDIADATDAANEAISAVDDLAGSMSDLGDAMGDMADLATDTSDAAQQAADAANDAVQAAQDAQNQTSGLTGLVYGAIAASLIAALAAIISLMQISKKIAG